MKTFSLSLPRLAPIVGFTTNTQAHGVPADFSIIDTLPSINGSPSWTANRQAKNWQNNGFVGDVTSSDIRCNQLSAGTTTATVAAGASVKVSVNPSAYHPGPFQSYLAKVPEGQDVNTWDPTGAVWFRIYAEQPKFGSQLTWLSKSLFFDSLVCFVVSDN
jgi:hypothetical protein